MSISTASFTAAPSPKPFDEGLEGLNFSTVGIKREAVSKVRGLRLVRYLMDSWFGAVLGGGIYGAWAVWANWAQGEGTAWGIGAAHWLTSALLTFFGTLAMRQFYSFSQGWAGSALALAGGLGLTYTSLFVVHDLLGTQQLFLTLAPGILPNIFFCVSYTLLLKRTMAVTA